MRDFYEITVAGLKRKLPLSEAGDDLMIAGFVILGDVELTCACAAELVARAPEFDFIVSPEAKAIPLAHEFAKQSGAGRYFTIRKAPKLYMDGVFETEVKSITTEGVQHLYMDGAEAREIKGKRVLLLDDVISTGESLAACEKLICAAGGEVAARMAILAEGDASLRKDIIFLERLPLFDGEGNPKP